MNNYHTTVLLKEAIDALNVRKGHKYIDGTIGGGGHTGIIIEKGGIVLGLDRDSEALEHVRQNLKSKNESQKLNLVKGNFREIRTIAEKNGFTNCSGILLDLGTSVHQIKNSSRGFSFSKHEKLDMRMDSDMKLTAKEIVNKWPKNDLVYLFEKFGEENEAVSIADAIIEKRKLGEIMYADELATIISNAKKRLEKDINPATKVFQALRIAVNEELDSLREGLEEGIEVLGSSGRMVVVSFHSLEDRIVKKIFIESEKKGLGKIITKKIVQASELEIKMNKKARSAKMRVFEKI